MQGILSGSNVFAKLDALKGYHQIPLHSKSRSLMMFLLPSGCYRYKRGPMGLSSKKDEWCARFDKVIAGVDGAFKIVDDILVAASNYPSLFPKLWKILDQCKVAKLTISKRKLQLGPKISFTGYIVSQEGVIADSSKVDSIKSYPQPTWVKDV